MREMKEEKVEAEREREEQDNKTNRDAGEIYRNKGFIGPILKSD